MSDGYTYTTISARPGERPGSRWRSTSTSTPGSPCPAADEGRPHLHIAHGEVSVSISPPAGTVTAEDVVIARRLADQAAEYAAEIERLREHQQADSSGTTAA